MFNLDCFRRKRKEELSKPIKKEYIVVNKEFENNECIICLEKMIKNDHIKILECGHIYHNKCIIEWFNRVNECPLCFK